MPKVVAITAFDEAGKPEAALIQCKTDTVAKALVKAVRDTAASL